MDSASKINFAGKTLLADTRRALYWPEEKTLLVADLHIGKAQDFVPRGTFLPPYEMHDISTRLKVLIADYDVRHLIAMGDSFHRPGSKALLQLEEADLLKALQGSVETWTFIEGNHDAGGFGEENWRVADEIKIGNIVLRHQCDQPAAEPAPMIVGHYHPKFQRMIGRQMVSKPCFIWDSQTLILPAFGTYTGGLSIHHKAIADLFENDYQIATADTQPCPVIFDFRAVNSAFG